jgi:hypothetical protein
MDRGILWFSSALPEDFWDTNFKYATTVYFNVFSKNNSLPAPLFDAMYSGILKLSKYV